MTRSSLLATNKLRLFLNSAVAKGLCFGIGLTIIFLYQVIVRAQTHLPSREDGIFIAWTINWISNALLNGTSIYNAPIFYPITNTLAFSDPFLTSGVANIPLVFFTKNILLQNNIHLIFGTVHCFWAMFMLAFYLTKKNLAAYVAATFFTFSSLHFHYVVHLHTYLIAGIPLTLYLIMRWLNEQQLRWFLLAILVSLAQTLNSPMTGFFTLASLLPVVWQPKKLWRVREQWLQVGSVLVCAAAVVGMVYAPYFAVSDHYAYTRSIRDAAHFSHSLNRFFSWELVLVYTLLIVGRKTFNKQFVLISLIGLILSLGPVLKLYDQTVKVADIPIPLPYAVLYYVVPGWQAFRASSRWITVFNVGISVLIGLTVAKMSKKSAAVVAVTLTAGLWITQASSLVLHQIPNTPNLYTHVQVQPEHTLAEFPVYVWSMHPYVVHENDRLLHQTVHLKKLYNGASGFTPPEREYYWHTISQLLPNDAVVSHLQQNGVQLVLVHFDEYQQLAANHYIVSDTSYPNADKLKHLISLQPDLKELHCENHTCLYRIEP